MQHPANANGESPAPTPAPGVIFGESAYTTAPATPADPVKHDPVQAAPSPKDNSLTGLIAQNPLLALAAVAALGVVAVVVLKKARGSSGDTVQNHMVRYAQYLEKAAKREYRRSGADKHVENIASMVPSMVNSAELQPLIGKVMEQFRRMTTTSAKT